MKVDTSTDDLDDMSFEMEPLFETRTVFLRAILLGETSLYGYRSKGLIRYFIKREGIQPEPLIFKSYKTSAKRFKYNTKYKQQLFSYLKCPGLSFKLFGNVDYNERELMELFIKYYNCKK